MAKFTPLTVKTLPTVMVHILASDQETKIEICRLMRTGLYDSLMLVSNMAEMFAMVLDMHKSDRAAYAESLDGVLDTMLENDAFGTEGQNDPRGDHRK